MSQFLYGHLPLWGRIVQGSSGLPFRISADIAAAFECPDEIPVLGDHRGDIILGSATVWTSSSGLHFSMPVRTPDARQAVDYVQRGVMGGVSADLRFRAELIAGVHEATELIKLVELTITATPAVSDSWFSVSDKWQIPPLAQRMQFHERSVSQRSRDLRSRLRSVRPAARPAAVQTDRVQAAGKFRPRNSPMLAFARDYPVPKAMLNGLAFMRAAEAGTGCSIGARVFSAADVQRMVAGGPHSCG